MQSTQLLDSEDSDDCHNKPSCRACSEEELALRTRGVLNELAALCALLGGAQSQQVTLNAMQVLQVQQSMAAQAATKQKQAEALLQAKIDVEVEMRTKDLAVLPSPSPAKSKTKTAKTADVAPDSNDDGVSLASGALKGATPRKKHAG